MEPKGNIQKKNVAFENDCLRAILGVARNSGIKTDNIRKEHTYTHTDDVESITRTHTQILGYHRHTQSYPQICVY